MTGRPQLFYNNTKGETMKIFYLTIILITATLCNLYAQPPQSFKYQAVVRNGTGEILQTQAVGIRVSIHDSISSGTVVYQETFSDTTNQFGIVNLRIGFGLVIIGTFSSIDWDNNSKYLEVEIDPAGGANYQYMGTSELLSVPYALFSSRSSLVSNEGSGNIFVGDSIAKKNTTGNSNAYVGFQSGYNNSTGYMNSFLGYKSGYNNTSGAGNTFIGNISGYSTTTGGLNTIIGDRSGYTNTEGAHNTYLGYKSGFSNVTGSNNVCLGYKAGFYETGSNKLYIHNEATVFPLIYGEFDNNLVRINGKLGIGTSSPTNLLELSSVSPKLYFNRESSASNLSGLYWRSTSDNFEGAFVRDNNTGAIELYSDTSGNTPRMTVLNGGDMGLGISTPATDFHLHRTGSVNTKFKLSNTATGTSLADGLDIGVTAYGNSFIMQQEYSSLELGTAGLNRLFIASDGNIGIGDFNLFNEPVSKLQIHDGEIRLSNAQTGATLSDGAKLELTTNHDFVITNNENADIEFSAYNQLNQLTLKPSGFIGLKTDLPSSDFTINQTASTTLYDSQKGIRFIESGSHWNFWTISMRNSSGGGNNFQFLYNGTFKASISRYDGSYFAGSDERLKHEIQQLDPVLDRVLKLNPRTYLMNDTPEQTIKSVGFIAQLN